MITVSRACTHIQPLKRLLSPRTKYNYRTISTRNKMSGTPKVLSSEDLSPSDAKWVTLKKLKWLDPEGKERVWESAERKTRGSAGIDAVAVLAILRSETNAFPTSTVIVEQFRPPVGKFVVELPAGNVVCLFLIILTLRLEM
ncbi:hypothetical protein QCA50_007875 [Cerrena zonata]|uniref:Uncharacterized protein n=1 Tax=Cerrena zonata TaxID=2478898 RepID=A0AAW0GHF7_9APHY